MAKAYDPVEDLILSLVKILTKMVLIKFLKTKPWVKVGAVVVMISAIVRKRVLEFFKKKAKKITYNDKVLEIHTSPGLLFSYDGIASMAWSAVGGELFNIICSDVERILDEWSNTNEED